MKRRDVEKILTDNGFSLMPKRGKGSHRMFEGIASNENRITTLPSNNEIKPGTLKAIIRQFGLSRDLFLSMSKGK